ncbi:NigD-like protein [Saccharicrinis aurantiacus]|uniref:NigD-like protein n=1 Tax=Saccharicrinis aurantiacus TaxID=1849719 RepID=UPI00249367C6|nr:NigD-like protein [Saccharicrinis aurantiacus]
MKKLLFALPLLLGLLSLNSCKDDDDGYSLGDYWLTTGTFMDSGSYYYIITDGGDTLWPSASNIPPNKHEEGDRVFVNYTILADGSEDSGYDYMVKINGTSEILTKPVFNFTEETTEETKDSIGHDPITIVDTWFTDKYLNVEFQYGGGIGIHYINLVKDTENLETPEGQIILELTHNKNGDPNNYLQWSVASFDLTELQEPGQESVDIFVRSMGKEGEYTYNKVLTYEYSPSIEHLPSVKTFDESNQIEQDLLQ